ncbi:hypothetical protein JEG40_11790 [Streptococcus agalactiae]|nr:hypothetical protein [Streptococcus agalactiae]
MNLPTGCAFHPRCRYARTMCSVVLPPTHSLHEHRYSCVLEEPLTLPAHHEQGVMTCNRAT